MTKQLKFLFLLSMALLSWGACPALAFTETGMQFEIERSPTANLSDHLLNGGYRRVYAYGEIDAAASERFVAFVDANRLENVQVVFDSPGGSLAEGLRLGRIIRSRGFSTAVGRRNDADQLAICASACAYAYLGGVARYYNTNSGRIGLHQFYMTDGTSDSSSAQVISGMLSLYLDEMGVRGVTLAMASLADRDGMVWLTEEDARTFKFANDGVVPATASIQLMEMTPYLRINQETRDFTARVLILCNSGTINMMFGIITSQEATESASSIQNYIEMDGVPFYERQFFEGITKENDTIWIDRIFNSFDIQILLRTRVLGGWLDGRMMRWGAEIDLSDVQPQLANFVHQCRSTSIR